MLIAGIHSGSKPECQDSWSSKCILKQILTFIVLPEEGASVSSRLGVKLRVTWGTIRTYWWPVPLAYGPWPHFREFCVQAVSQKSVSCSTTALPDPAMGSTEPIPTLRLMSHPHRGAWCPSLDLPCEHCKSPLLSGGCSGKVPGFLPQDSPETCSCSVVKLPECLILKHQFNLAYVSV